MIVHVAETHAHVSRCVSVEIRQSHLLRLHEGMANARPRASTSSEPFRHVRRARELPPEHARDPEESSTTTTSCRPSPSRSPTQIFATTTDKSQRQRSPTRALAVAQRDRDQRSRAVANHAAGISATASIPPSPSRSSKKCGHWPSPAAFRQVDFPQAPGRRVPKLASGCSGQTQTAVAWPTITSGRPFGSTTQASVQSTPMSDFAQRALGASVRRSISSPPSVRITTRPRVLDPGRSRGDCPRCLLHNHVSRAVSVQIARR